MKTETAISRRRERIDSKLLAKQIAKWFSQHTAEITS